MRTIVFLLLIIANCFTFSIEQTTAQTTILLVDDYHILYRSGTKRSLNQLSRFKNNPVIPQTKPWELTIAYCSVYRDQITGKYKLWYQAAHKKGNHLAY